MPADPGSRFRNVRARTVRARLTEAGDEKARVDVVVKFAADGAARSIASSMGSYECEVGFCSELSTRAGVAVPRCLRADIDPDSGAFVLVIGDLAPARCGDQLIGATDDEIAAAVSTAARLHARWWADSMLDSLEWLPPQAPLVWGDALAGVVG